MPTSAAPATAACPTVAPLRSAVAIAVDSVSMAAARSLAMIVGAEHWRTVEFLPAQVQRPGLPAVDDVLIEQDATELVGQRAVLHSVGRELVEGHGEGQGQLRRQHRIRTSDRDASVALRPERR